MIALELQYMQYLAFFFQESFHCDLGILNLRQKQEGIFILNNVNRFFTFKNKFLCFLQLMLPVFKWKLWKIFILQHFCV